MDITGLKSQESEAKTEWAKVPGTDMWVNLRFLLPRDLDRIGKRKDLYKRGQINAKLYQEAVLDECVLEWDNIFLEDKPFPCTKQNKVTLDGLMVQFRILWKRYSGFITPEDDDSEEEDELPNS